MKNSPKPNYRDYTLEELYEAEASIDREKYPERYNEIRTRIKQRKSTEPNYDEYTLEELYEAEASIDREKYPERYNKIRARIQEINKLANSDYRCRNDRLTEKFLTNQSKARKLETVPFMNPWISIWVKPGATIQQIINSENYGIRLLVYSYGIIHGLVSAVYEAENAQELFGRSVFAIILGPIIGIIVFSFIGTMVYLIGKQMAGKASRSNIYTVLAWSSLPLTSAKVFELIFKVIEFIFNLTTTSFIIIESIIILINFITTIWAFIIVVNCLKKVQEFTMFKTIISALSIPTLNIAIGIILQYISP